MSVLLAPSSFLDPVDADLFKRRAFVPTNVMDEASLLISGFQVEAETFLERRMRESAEDLGPGSHGLGPKAADQNRSPRTHLDLVEALRLSLDLADMSEAPRSGICFTAILTNGKRVTAERFDDAFVCGNTDAPSRPIPASEFCGWLPGSEDHSDSLPPLAPLDDEYSTAADLGRED